MESFADIPLCQGHTPHPLGEDSERFLYLINDIKNRKDDYAAQLSHVTLASLSEKKTTDDETKHTIMSSLLGRNTRTARQGQDTRSDILWHARLVLKIAEILDSEDQEVAQALIALEDSETDLFDRLKGKDDEESNTLYADLKKITNTISKPTRQSVKNRLRAWFRFIQNGSLPNCSFWSTDRQEVADILFDNHLDRYNSMPVNTASLELPVHLGKTAAEVMVRYSDFICAAENLLPVFRQQITTVDKRQPGETAISERAEQWKKVLDTYYPLESFGRMTASFYRFESPLPFSAGLKSSEVIQGPVFFAVFPS